MFLMKLGIIGKPQSGKTTVFNAAAGQQETVGDFSKVVHRAQIKVPDERVDTLAELVKPGKVTHAAIEFLDAPGLSGKGKESGKIEISEDLRQTDAFLMVIDAFSPDATPEVDIRMLQDEMVLLDNVLIDNLIDKRARKMKVTGDKSEQKHLELLKRCLGMLDEECPLLEGDLTADEVKQLRGYRFLTMKPYSIVLNISEDDLVNIEGIRGQYAKFVNPGKCEVAVMCGKMQMELIGLDEDERDEFMQGLGIEASATDKVIRRSYELLGLISFMTFNESELRAWTIKRDSTAVTAARAVHTDIARGFIRAEVVAYDDYVALKTPAALKAAGKQRLEGKEYVVADGDIIQFRFNV